MDITVLIATYKRPDILRQTLESFLNLDSEGIAWEIIVVDNAGDLEILGVVEDFQRCLPVSCAVEQKAGKNAALNRALPLANGRLILFTDDDVTADPRWLQEVWQGASRWPDAAVFGGKILPEWPQGKVPFQGVAKNFFASAFTIADWQDPEGPYPAERVWGPNMAIRREIFERGYRFNSQIGPSGENYIMGSETEMTRRLEREGFPAVYLPGAVVHHRIRPEQTRMSWIFGRAFRYGRADAFHESHRKVKVLFGAPRYLYRSLAVLSVKRFWAHICWNSSRSLNLGIQYWMTRGQIYQFRKKSGNYS